MEITLSIHWRVAKIYLKNKLNAHNDYANFRKKIFLFENEITR